MFLARNTVEIHVIFVSLMYDSSFSHQRFMQCTNAWLCMDLYNMACDIECIPAIEMLKTKEVLDGLPFYWVVLHNNVAVHTIHHMVSIPVYQLWHFWTTPAISVIVPVPSSYNTQLEGVSYLTDHFEPWVYKIMLMLVLLQTLTIDGDLLNTMVL